MTVFYNYVLPISSLHPLQIDTIYTTWKEIRENSWGWWDEWDDTALQTQDSKFESLRSEAEHATSRSRRLPTILNLNEWAGKNIFFFETWMPEWGSNPQSRITKQAALTTAPRPPAVVHEDDNGRLRTERVQYLVC